MVVIVTVILFVISTIDSFGIKLVLTRVRVIEMKNSGF
jgi:hypothetical protein